MKDNKNIDELLNSFIDGELDPRHETEVKRLLAHDAQIAERLRQLEKTKMLVGSLPSAEAPPSLLYDIKSSLERRTLLEGMAENRERKKGARQLIFRKLVTAAAMIALAGGLVIVIYDILAPVSRPEAPVAMDTRRPVTETAAEKPSSLFPAAEFNGTLELATSSFMAVEAVINRAIYINEIEHTTDSKGGLEKLTYRLTCGQQDLAALMQDVQNIWPKIASATLRIEAGTAGSEISVDNVTPDQVNCLAVEKTLEKRIELAGEFAALNTSPPRQPDEKLPAVADNAKQDLSAIPRPIPKPLLTSAEKTTEKTQSGIGDDRQINLTIELIEQKKMN
jgi:hypothetical protein